MSAASPVPAAADAPAPTLTVGIDIAKATFVAACWEGGRGEDLGTFANDPDGFAQLAERLGTRLAADETPWLVLEPTGGYELALAAFALARHWAVSRPNAALVRDWGRGLGGRAKTDRLDARLLARFGAERQPPRWHPLARAAGELESLQRRKEDLEGLLRQERNRQQALAARPDVAPAVPASVGRLVAALEEELRAIERAIAGQLAQHPPLQAVQRRLRDLPGVGPATVLPLHLVLARWDALTQGRGTAAGLLAYAGLDPQPCESGTSVHRRAASSRKGSRTLRHQLFMAVLGGVRGRNPLRAFYERLVGRGKPKKVALIAAARKLLVWAWAVYRTGQPYDPARLAHLGLSSA